MIKQACFATMVSVSLLSTGWLCADANAQSITVEQYQHPKSEKELNSNRPYLEGIKDGLIAYNISVDNRLFCLGGMPPTLSFEQASDILLLWARKRKGDAAGLSLGLAMLYSLKEAFPCKGTAR
jgi:hypothetical protein